MQQTHNGTGDIIGRDKIVQSITPDAFKNPVENILSHLRHKNISQAQEILNVLSAAASKNSQTDIIIKVVSLHIQLAKNTGDYIETVMDLKRYLPEFEDMFCKGVVQSALLRLEAANDQSNDARLRFNLEDKPNALFIEAFF